MRLLRLPANHILSIVVLLAASAACAPPSPGQESVDDSSRDANLETLPTSGHTGKRVTLTPAEPSYSFTYTCDADAPASCNFAISYTFSPTLCEQAATAPLVSGGTLADRGSSHADVRTLSLRLRSGACGVS